METDGRPNEDSGYGVPTLDGRGVRRRAADNAFMNHTCFMRILISAAALLLALTACGSDGDDSKDSKADEPSVDFQDVFDQCETEVLDKLNEGGGPELGAEAVMRVGDGGESLDVSPLQAESFLVEPSVLAATCALEESGAPDSVVSEVGQISGMDGRQEASWDGVDLTYSYDGNSGFTGVFTAK